MTPDSFWERLWMRATRTADRTPPPYRTADQEAEARGVDEYERERAGL